MVLRTILFIVLISTFGRAQSQEPPIPQYVNMLHTDFISTFDFGIYKLQNDIRYVFRESKNINSHVDYDARAGKIIVSIWYYLDQKTTVQELKNNSKENISIVYEFILSKSVINNSDDQTFSNFYFKYFSTAVLSKIDYSDVKLLISDLVKNLSISYNIRYKTTENKINVFTAKSDFITQQVYFTE